MKDPFLDRIYIVLRRIILLGIVVLAAWLLFYPEHKIEEQHADGSVSVLIWSNFGNAWVINCERTNSGTYKITQSIKGNITEEEFTENGTTKTYYHIYVSPLKSVVFKKQSTTKDIFSRKDIVFCNKSVGTIINAK